MDGHWGTVCNNSQKGIVGEVCSQLGYPTESKTCKVIYHRSTSHALLMQLP